MRAVPPQFVEVKYTNCDICCASSCITMTIKAVEKFRFRKLSKKLQPFSRKVNRFSFPEKERQRRRRYAKCSLKVIFGYISSHIAVHFLPHYCASRQSVLKTLVAVTITVGNDDNLFQNSDSIYFINSRSPAIVSEFSNIQFSNFTL